MKHPLLEKGQSEVLLCNKYFARQKLTDSTALTQRMDQVDQMTYGLCPVCPDLNCLDQRGLRCHPTHTSNRSRWPVLACKRALCKVPPCTCVINQYRSFPHPNQTKPTKGDCTYTRDTQCTLYTSQPLHTGCFSGLYALLVITDCKLK